MKTEFYNRRRQRGSTFILVLAMLSILALIAAAFSYTSRLEGVSSDNFARATAARAAVASGLVTASSMVSNSVELTSPLQPWNRASIATAENGSPVTNAAASERREAASGRDEDPDTAPAALSITDLSGRVNVNAISDPKAFERFLNAVFAGGGSDDQRSVAAQNRVREILEYRGGEDDKDSSASLQPDLRRAAVEGTRRFQSLNDLRRRSKVAPQLFTSQELEVLKSHITVFSQSPEVFNLPDGRTIAKASLSETTGTSVLRSLQEAFPDKDPRLLMQFSANIADFTDSDDQPTLIRDANNPDVWNTVIGSEQVPLIVEVYPDAKTSLNGDQGQFVELHNPWAKPILVDGWSLNVGGGGGQLPASSGVTLNGVIPPNGYLIITDNYDQPSTDSPPETGSFLSIFGARKDDNLRRVIDNRSFDLPDKNSYVTLTAANGALIDVFSYTSAAAPDAKQSYQRNDPRVRSFDTKEATPFSDMTEQGDRPAGAKDLAEAWKYGNMPFSSPITVMKVSTAYAGLKSQGARAVMFDPHPWQSPEVQLEEKDSATNLDIGLIDLFYVPQGFAVAEKPNTGSGLRRARAVTNAAVDTATSTGVVFSYGKLNLNTCAPIALYSLGSGETETPVITAKVVQEFESYRQKELAARRTPFRNVSDFARQFFATATDKDLESLGQVLNQVTVSSSSFQVVSQHRGGVTSSRKSDGARKSAKAEGVAARMEWTVAFDVKPYSLVNFASLP